MVKRIFSKQVGAILAAGIALAGCDFSPEQSVTDAFVQTLMAQTDDDQTLVGTYHIMTNNEGEQIGVVFIENATSKAGSDCIEYSSFADGGYVKSTQSITREACLPSGLTLQNEPNPNLPENLTP